MSFNRPGYCNLCESSIAVKDGLCSDCISKLKKEYEAPTILKVGGKRFYCTEPVPANKSISGHHSTCGGSVFHKEKIMYEGQETEVYVCNCCGATYLGD